MKATANQTAAPNVQNHSKANQAKPVAINSEKQYRLILAILNGEKGINELIPIVGVNNVPDVARRLRAKKWQITTVDRKVINRDGEQVTAGAYRLDTPIEIAKEALRAYKA
jgi:hypothetical protein